MKKVIDIVYEYLMECRDVHSKFISNFEGKYLIHKEGDNIINRGFIKGVYEQQQGEFTSLEITLENKTVISYSYHYHDDMNIEIYDKKPND